MKQPATKARPLRLASVTPVYHAGPLIDGPENLQLAVEALRLADPQSIPAMLNICGAVPLRRSEPGFEGLASIIISQQVSVASANAIFARLKAAFSPLTSEAIYRADDADIRACGLSTPKINALRALATAVDSAKLDLARLANLSASDAHNTLVALKGIGPWTADIFLMFCLGHPDAWPAGDIALQEAAKMILKLDTRPDARALERIGERWRPHRAVAARILWAYYKVAKSGRDGVPV